MTTPTPLRTPRPSFAHLARLSDRHGTFEHAQFTTPRREHGYCTDDMARVLVATAREPAGDATVATLLKLALQFVCDASGVDGGFRNRMNQHGHWEDLPKVEDAWGRSIWGLGTAIAHAEVPAVRTTASDQFAQAVHRRAIWPRAMAFAALGAAEVLSVMPNHRSAHALLVDAAAGMAPPRRHPAWRWPEERLTYANAVLPEAMIAAGVALDSATLRQQGLDLLDWLLQREMAHGHISVTPVGGAGPSDRGPGFDQQPIEVAALADACARAATIDGSARWTMGVAASVAWFLGENDTQAVMWDPTSGGGFDGLEVDGVNRNQGAESTLALVTTLQHANAGRPVDQLLVTGSS